MKKYFKVLTNASADEKLQHELTIITKEKKDKIVHKLRYSNHEDWTNPGQLILKVIDTRDNYEFQFFKTDISKLEYDDAEYLQIILKHANQYGLKFKLKNKIRPCKHIKVV